MYDTVYTNDYGMTIHENDAMSHMDSWRRIQPTQDTTGRIERAEASRSMVSMMMTAKGHVLGIGSWRVLTGITKNT